jgi:methionine synthase I (cobalamin-dependent)
MAGDDQTSEILTSTGHRSAYLEAVAKKVVIFDGATGTWLQ